MYNTFGQDNLDESINIGQTEKNLKEKKRKEKHSSSDTNGAMQWICPNLVLTIML